MRSALQSEAQTEDRKSLRTGSDLEKRFPLAMALYGILALLVWFTMDAGKVIAMGTPRELKERSAGKSTIEITCADDLRTRTIPEFPDATQTRLSDDGRSLSVSSTRAARTLVEIVKWVDAQGIALEDVHLARPTLEDVFIELTGKRLRE